MHMAGHEQWIWKLVFLCKQALHTHEDMHWICSQLQVDCGSIHLYLSTGGSVRKFDGLWQIAIFKNFMLRVRSGQRAASWLITTGSRVIYHCTTMDTNILIKSNPLMLQLPEVTLQRHALLLIRVPLIGWPGEDGDFEMHCQRNELLGVRCSR